MEWGPSLVSDKKTKTDKLRFFATKPAGHSELESVQTLPTPPRILIDEQRRNE